MMIYGQPVADFVTSQIGFDWHPGEYSAIGFCEGGEIVAGFVYHDWRPERLVLEISGASLHRGWANKARLSAIFSYPFDQLKCRLVMARYSERNKTVSRIWRSLGADEYVIPELRGPSEAEVIATLSAETWRSGRFGR